MRYQKTIKLLATILGALLAFTASAQLTLPPNGGSQRAEITQYIGMVKVTISYGSPKVTGPRGEDRRGKIWGGVVPYGLNNLGFGRSSADNPSPWRAGANENTVITFSHDVTVQGEPLAAGSYGFHVIPQEEGPWTLIFSNDYTSWGSFFYNPENDALRVETQPVESPYFEWLNYSFTNRQLQSTTAVLRWESLAIPFQIAVPNIGDLYVEELRKELKSQKGFTNEAWRQAVSFCLNNRINLEEALEWSETMVSGPMVGLKNYTTLSLKGGILYALDRVEAADKIMDEAIQEPTAEPALVDSYATNLIAADRKDRAMEVFEASKKRFPDSWIGDFGMAKAFSAKGDFKKAQQFMAAAKKRAPENRKEALGKLEESLKNKQDITATKG